MPKVSPATTGEASGVRTMPPETMGESSWGTRMLMEPSLPPHWRSVLPVSENDWNPPFGHTSQVPVIVVVSITSAMKQLWL